MMAVWPKSWAVSSAARWGRGWSGRRSELSLTEGEGALGASQRGGGRELARAGGLSRDSRLGQRIVHVLAAENLDGCPWALADPLAGLRMSA
jgi:hypothetical protein